MKVEDLGLTQTHFSGASFVTTALSATVKIAMGVLTQSTLVLLNGAYLVALGTPKAITFFSRLTGGGAAEVGQPTEESAGSQRLIALSLVALGITFVVFMLGSDGSSLGYTTIPAISFATCAFTKLGVAIWGMVKLRGQKGAAVASGKITSLADGMASIVLTQMALRSLAGQSTDLFDVAFGVAVGVAIAGMGLYCAFSGRMSSETR